MKKIPNLFLRDHAGDGKITRTVNPESAWVLDPLVPKKATRKIDGTCCMVRDGALYKRYDAKRGKTPPRGFEPAQDPDPITGHHPGWVPVGEGPEDQYHRDAYGCLRLGLVLGMLSLPNGTYELCGPKINGNPEGIEEHVLIQHGQHVLSDVPTEFDALIDYLRPRDIEGIVWWCLLDDRKAKVRKADFGLPRVP